MLLFYLIISIVSVTVAQQSSISCEFTFIGAAYGCRLRIENANNWNNFTEIDGIHMNGFTNSNVTAVYCHRCQGQSPSTIIPSIICDTFPNLSIFEYVFTGVTEIDDNSFRYCSRLAELVLRSNSISSITSNAFINLRNVNNLDLTENLITNLPGNVFANQQSLTTLRLRSNVLDDDTPINLFWPLENLQILDMIGCNLNANISELLGKNTRLKQLFLHSNRFTLDKNSFAGLEQLEYLYLWNNSIDAIPNGTFAPTPNILGLYLDYNDFTELSADTFTGLKRLTGLFIGFNPIERIDDKAFEMLENLNILDVFACNLSHLNSSSIRMLKNLSMINVAFNRIEQLEQNLFASMPNLIQIDLSSNRLKTLNRNSFGNLTNLQYFYMRQNELNELDRAIIDDARNLNVLDFAGNLCADARFPNFMANRSQYLPMLETCFSNFEDIDDGIITEGDANYQLFNALGSGIAIRVRADGEVQIALQVYNVVGIPMIEIFIGTANNTQSIIRLNQQTDVVSVPTINIIAPNRWNDFRITWANQTVQVFRSDDSAPFMRFIVLYPPFNFYGLRSVESRALWSVQPV